MHGGAERAQTDGEQQRWDPPLARPPTATGLQQGAAPCRGQHGSVCQLCAAGNHLSCYALESGRENVLTSAGRAQGRASVTAVTAVVQQTDAEQSTAGPGRSDQGEVESAHEIRHSCRTEHETQHVQQLHEILPACLSA